MAKPVRIQRKRTKGFKLPAGCVYVGRPTRWGNPYKAAIEGDAKTCVEMYREHFWRKSGRWMFDASDLDVRELRGKDLACWCPLVDKDGNHVPCHADVLLEIANRES